MNMYKSNYDVVGAARVEGGAASGFNLIKCTGYGAMIKPVPTGVEVLGSTSIGVRTVSGLWEIREGDWVVRDEYGNVIVLSDRVFSAMYTKV